jgi:predicted TIM-barrel fold metal-dependent hydrolase
MRIDAHSHAMHAARDAQGRFRPPVTAAWRPGEWDAQELVRQHRERGVERVLLLDPPEGAFQMQAWFPDFVVPIPMVDPDTLAPADVDRLLSRGAPGLKFIAPMHSYGDNRYLPLYAVLRDRHALAVFHTGYLADALFTPGSALGREDYVDITNMRPAAVDRIARAFPDLKILMAHFGNPWWEEAWKMISSHPNIYADFSGGTAYRRSLTMWREIFAPNGRLDTAAVGKLCFGSYTTHFVPGQYDYLPYIEFYERFYEALQVPAELRQKVDRENVLALLCQ